MQYSKCCGLMMNKDIKQLLVSFSGRLKRCGLMMNKDIKQQKIFT